MKKIIILILTSVFLFGITGCGKKDAFEKISYEQYQVMRNEKQNFILYVGSKTCVRCDEFKPILNKVIRSYDLDVVYLDVSELSEDEADSLFDEASLKGTPTILFIKEGNIDLFTRVIGAQTEENLIKKFKSAGYIK